MRLKRDGDTYETWFKPDAKGDWVWVGKAKSVLKDSVKVGIYSGIAETDKGTLEVKFDNFLEASSSVTVVDSKNRLTTTWGDLKTQCPQDTVRNVLASLEQNLKSPAPN